MARIWHNAACRWSRPRAAGFQPEGRMITPRRRPFFSSVHPAALHGTALHAVRVGSAHSRH
jgi:hypothetical protein